MELFCSAFQNGFLVYLLYTELCRYAPTSAQDMWKMLRMFTIADDATWWKIK